MLLSKSFKTPDSEEINATNNQKDTLNKDLTTDLPSKKKLKF